MKEPVTREAEIRTPTMTMDTATIRAGSIALTLETVPTTKTQATADRGPMVHPTVKSLHCLNIDRID
jgi:hypothetical protein